MKDLNNARTSARKASEELQDAADNAAREKNEMDEQRSVLEADMLIATQMKNAAKKERDDCLRAQQRLDKEEQEAQGYAHLRKLHGHVGTLSTHAMRL